MHIPGWLLARCKFIPVHNHFIVQASNLRTARSNTQKRKKGMRHAGKPASDHADGKTHRVSKVLKIGFPDRSRMFSKDFCELVHGVPNCWFVSKLS